jgi:acyl-CoA synthetase (AMP-forming)/AMP-acid ligase II/acyl carrier protein
MVSNDVAGGRLVHAEHHGPVPVGSGERPESLAQYVTQLVALNPDGEVHEIDRYGRRNSASYGTLFRRALALSDRLPGAAAGEPPKAIICVTSVLDFIVAAWACLLSGIDIFPFDPALALTNADEFRRRLEAMKSVLGDSVVLADTGLSRTVLRSDDLKSARIIQIEDVFPGAFTDGRLPDISVCPATVRHSNLLISTSGTGGEPKIAVIDNITATRRFFDGYRQDDQSCLYTIAHHTVAGIRLLLPLGRRVVYLHPLRLVAKPDDWFQAIEDHCVTDVGLSSSTAAMLCNAMAKPDFSWRNLRSLRRISIGAEVIVPQVVKQLLIELKDRIADRCQVSLVYSMTETGPIYWSIMPLDEVLTGLETVSEPVVLKDCVRGWSVRCVDETGHVVGEGQPGTVQVRSENKLFAGYYAGADGVLSQRDGDGWFDTGDVAVMSDRGLVLKGREKSTIIVNARKVTCEEIEARLRANENLKSLKVIVAALRDEDQITDEVAAFVVVPDDGTMQFSDVKTQIVRDVSRHFGLSVKHVVAIAEDDVERTATMKVRRDALLDKYKKGGISLDRGSRSPVRSPEHAAFLQMWQDALDLETPPDMDSDFFDLGGDSLGGARLFAAVESTFSRQIDMDEFFSKPTPRHLLELVAQTPVRSRGEETNDGPSVLHSLTTYVASWRGTRLSRDSLVRGFNVTGTRPPVFWVCQGYREALRLSRALGRDQPVYALRSAFEIVSTEDYSETALREVLDRYFREILTAAGEREFSLGGNCQGSVIALLLAKRFTAIGREPKCLFLAEWYRDFDRYDGPARIVLCGGSPMWAGRDIADLQAHQNRFFPQGTVHVIPVGYAETVARRTIHHLASVLERDLGPLPVKWAARWIAPPRGT